jgi:hypothetical protein
MRTRRFRYDACMVGRWFLFTFLIASACTRPNEAKQCSAGTCTTPDFPFCDVTGFASGEAGTCVAVTCEPGSFGECRGDAEVRCNGTGNNYDVVQCERGCDAAAGGCKLCDPNETACTNGTLATCDASGAVVSKEACALGCFENQPRCRDIDPSNGLAAYVDMVSNPPDLDLSSGGIITTSNGQISSQSSGSIQVPSFLISASPAGAQMRVFVANRVRLGNVTVAADTPDWGQGPALAIVASADITVEGTVDLTDVDRPSPGGVSFAACIGTMGVMNTGSGAQLVISGSGGGGHATAGGGGGDVGSTSGGSPGGVSGTEALVPLRGGCSSDSLITGGGAIQLGSRTRVAVSGTINANGGSGIPMQDAIAGGGGGGGILLEAPIVELGASAKLLANGGSGASYQAAGTPSFTLAPAVGGKCSPPNVYCGDGGNGAAVTVDATNGASPSYSPSPAVVTAGSGGGGLGRIRINTRDATYTKASSAIEAGALTTGTLATR